MVRPKERVVLVPAHPEGTKQSMQNVLDEHTIYIRNVHDMCAIDNVSLFAPSCDVRLCSF